MVTASCKLAPTSVRSNGRRHAGACHVRRTCWRAACRGYSPPATCAREASSVLRRRWARARSQFSLCIACCANSPTRETCVRSLEPEAAYLLDTSQLFVCLEQNDGALAAVGADAHDGA